ncbi:extracellular solute-binding protein [Bacillaceae bacterium SIJ1]|uniref:extracellular solute-binding protein n=1 Tax=Litoribacterium kuwaitense TaxID=1398745 RepID=UPI0013EDB94E|nr:extracellular solute-binding protein [Litoribacterium kuwaitense]NGP44599.1 extracellular solute-binding protein [Litoribacterium kuwaitense]
MKYSTRGFIFVMALLLTVILSSCNSESQEAGSSAPMNLEIIRSGNNLPMAEDDVIKQALDKALGVDISFSVVSSEYENQLNVRMAAGDYPDLFGVTRTSLVEFANKGLLLDLTDYMDQLQPVEQFIGEENVKKAMVDGKIYGITVPPNIPYHSYWIRKDWLDNLGLQAPTTLDEFIEVADAFTNQDPDGNGKNDTFAITGAVMNAFQPIFGAFGVGMPGSFYIKDDKLINAYHDPAMKDALSYINTLIDAGFVDPELVTNTGLQYQEKAFQGKFGIVYIDWPNMSKEEFVKQYKTVNPDAEWIQMAGPEGPGGQFDGTLDIGTTSGLFAIPKALEEEPEKLNEIFELLNYVAGEEGSNLVQYGIEGEHFNIEDGQVVPTELLNEEGSYFWLYQFAGRPEKEYLKTKFAAQTEYIEFADKRPRIEALDGFVDIPQGYNPADAERFAEEEIIKFVYGKRPLDEYEDFIETLETTMNYRLYIEAAHEQLAELGFIDERGNHDRRAMDG